MIALLTGWLTLPPSVNAAHGVTTRAGRPTVYLRREVVQWKRDAVTCLCAAWQDAQRINACRHNDAPLFVTLTAYMTAAQLRRRDTDNLAKVTLDTVLLVYLALDDVRVTDLHITKRLTPPTEEPGLFVSVYEMEGQDEELFAPIVPATVEGTRPTFSSTRGVVTKRRVAGTQQETGRKVGTARTKKCA